MRPEPGSRGSRRTNDSEGPARRPAADRAGEPAPRSAARPAVRADGGGAPNGLGGVGDADGVDAEFAGRDGAELARAVLEAARVRREARPPNPRRSPGTGRRLRGYSGPGPDPRDPAPLNEIIARLVKVRGWQRPAAEARIFGTWEQLVGPDLAAHCRPTRLVDGELTIEAESTAWATQLRGLAGPLLARIGSEVGRDVVRRIHVHGPVAPSWGRGPKRVRGRGPRDTYG